MSKPLFTKFNDDAWERYNSSLAIGHVVIVEWTVCQYNDNLRSELIINEPHSGKISCSSAVEKVDFNGSYLISSHIHKVKVLQSFLKLPQSRQCAVRCEVLKEE